jgi:uncharacterized membrane protein YhhN
MSRLFSFTNASAFTLAMVLLLLVGERLERPRLRAVAKSLASAGFLAAAVAVGAPDSKFGRFILAGLAISAVGDLLLLSHRRGAFLGGLGAFLVAHLAYAAAFVVRGIVPGAA